MVPVIPAAVRRPGSGRREDGGEPLAAPSGPPREPDRGGPRRSSGLAGGGVEGGPERGAEDECRPDRGAAGLRGEAGPGCGGRWASA